MGEIIRLKYIGGKTLSKLYFNRVRYVFNKENDFTENVPRMLWNFVKQTNEFIPAPIVEEKSVSFSGTSDMVETEPEEKKPEQKEKSDNVICDICGFKARSPYGLVVHKRKHQKKEAK